MVHHLEKLQRIFLWIGVGGEDKTSFGGLENCLYLTSKWRLENKKLSLIRCCLGSGSEDSHKKELQIPAYPYVGMGRPTTSLSLRPGPNHWGTLSLTGTFGGI